MSRFSKFEQIPSTFSGVMVSANLGILKLSTRFLKHYLSWGPEG